MAYGKGLTEAQRALVARMTGCEEKDADNFADNVDGETDQRKSGGLDLNKDGLLLTMHRVFGTTGFVVQAEVPTEDEITRIVAMVGSGDGIAVMKGIVWIAGHIMPFEEFGVSTKKNDGSHWNKGNALVVATTRATKRAMELALASGFAGLYFRGAGVGADDRWKEMLDAGNASPGTQEPASNGVRQPPTPQTHRNGSGTPAFSDPQPGAPPPEAQEQEASGVPGATDGGDHWLGEVCRHLTAEKVAEIEDYLSSDYFSGVLNDGWNDKDKLAEACRLSDTDAKANQAYIRVKAIYEARVKAAAKTQPA